MLERKEAIYIQSNVIINYMDCEIKTNIILERESIKQKLKLENRLRGVIN